MENADEQLKTSREELRMLYQLDTAAIQDFKRRQWDVVVWGLGLLGAIVAFRSKLMRSVNVFDNNCWLYYVEFIFELILAFSIFFAGWVTLGSLEIAIEKCRKRKYEAKKYFQNEFKDAISKDSLTNHKKIKWYHLRDLHDNRPYDNRHFLLFLSVLGVGTLLVVCYFIFDFVCLTIGLVLVLSIFSVLLIVMIIYIKRRKGMNLLKVEMLQEIIRRIVEVAHPERIILFGSAARGEMGPDSDVDLLIIKSGEYNQSTLESNIYMNLFGVNIAIDIILATPEQVEKYKNINYLVIAPAIREGKEIYHA